MNKYVVAYLSFFGNELKQKIVEADSELEAGLKFMGIYTVESLDDNALSSISDIDELDEFLSNCDSTIRVIKI